MKDDFKHLTEEERKFRDIVGHPVPYFVGFFLGFTVLLVFIVFINTNDQGVFISVVIVAVAAILLGHNGVFTKAKFRVVEGFYIGYGVGFFVISVVLQFI